MLLEPLVSTIETIKERIDAHGPALRENEIRTRMALIDPLLQALGWDTANPAMVAPEYSAGNGRADYALLNGAVNPVAFIEAKHLGEPLERPQHEDQLFTYALRQQVKFAALTDGNRWLLDDVSVFSGGERRLLQVSISDTPSHETALKLLLLWRPNLASEQPAPANAPVILGVPVMREPVTPEPELLGQADSGSWISLAKVETGKGQTTPVAIRFSGGQMRPIKNWWQVLTEVAKELAEDGLLTTADWAFSKPREISGGLYLNVYMNSKNIVSCSKKLLSHFRVDPGTVELQFE